MYLKDPNQSKKRQWRPNNLTSYGAISIFRKDYGYREVIQIIWDPSTSTLKDLHFIYRFLKSVKKEKSIGHTISIDWIVHDLYEESIAMGKDLEELMEMNFQFV